MTKIYCMETASLDIETLLPTVPQWRREKIERFRFDKDKRLSLGAALLLQKCGIEDEIAFAEHGKPYFPHHSDVRFSISHSGTWACCGFSDREIGVDIERIDPSHLALAEKCLTAQEKAYLAQSEDPARTFMRFWVGKESVMKCTGLGLSLPPHAIDIDLESGICGKYRIAQFDAIEGYCLALCMEKNSFETAVLCIF